MPPVINTVDTAARAPPSTGVLDLARLLAAIAITAVQRPRQFSLGATFRAWARRTAGALASENFIVNLGVKRLLLVGSPELSRRILAQYPSRNGFSSGSLKRSAMAFLAARALTISDDDDWRRRRAFNEAVLEPTRPHELAADFVRYTLRAFSSPIAGVADLRAAMGRTMLAVVFGGRAPETLIDDIENLFGLVQDPIKRMLMAPWAQRRRVRFYNTLRALWNQRNATVNPSLIRMADRTAGALDEPELIEQIPHWMFTFTGSGTELLTRTLALIGSAPRVHARVLAEIQDAGPVDEQYNFANLRLLEACLLEAAQLYPPVTRTFHRALDGATVGDVRIPVGIEIMHLFPPATAEAEGADDFRRFDPDRWMRAEPPELSFDPFLGGARHCPGKNVILLICKVALASLLARQQLLVDAPPLRASPLPAEFPRRGLSFHATRGLQ